VIAPLGAFTVLVPHWIVGPTCLRLLPWLGMNTACGRSQVLPFGKIRTELMGRLPATRFRTIASTSALTRVVPANRVAAGFSLF
jgi:hypothetical protein